LLLLYNPYYISVAHIIILNFFLKWQLFAWVVCLNWIGLPPQFFKCDKQ
jgi:hypothetical protein